MDLNSDEVKDIVIADGVEIDSIGHVVAIDGETGQILWTHTSNGDLYASAQFFNINGDDVPDIVIGGRVSNLLCLDGSTGSVIWEFDTAQASPGGQGWLQFYEPKSIPDKNDDNVVELVVMNGGDPTAAPSSMLRKPGHLLLLDGATGTVLHHAVTPDSAESYCSVVVLNGNTDSDTFIFFGTGGETVNGSMWRTTVADLVNNDISNATRLVEGINKGFIAPPSLADITGDGIYDIVCAGMDGIITVVNGSTLQNHWSYQNTELETYSVPGIGDLDGDGILDVFVNMNHGAWPNYQYCVQLGFDGADGTVLIQNNSGVQISSPLVHDTDGDGLAEGIISMSPGYSFGDCGIAFHRIGQPVEDAFVVPSALNIGSSPLLADLDADGLLDLITIHYTDTLNYLVTRWDTDFSSHPEPHWGAYHGSDHNGIYPLSSPVTTPDPVRSGRPVWYTADGIVAQEGVRAEVFDLSGRSVLLLSTSTNRLIPNSSLASGVYVIRGAAGDNPFHFKIHIQ